MQCSFVFRCTFAERKFRYTPETVGKIKNAYAVLHNITIVAGLEYDIDFNDEIAYKISCIK